MSRAKDRIERAVAIVSNNGGTWSNQWDEMELRNRLVTNSHVDLFGKESAWGNFRRRWFFPPATPRNYCGEIAGTWANDTILRLCEQYKVAVCLENSCEPYYFTEKFVNAVRSGCIPVYHAHPTVAGGILKNARWVDPAHHGLDAERTLRYALTEDLAEYHRINEAWLFSEEVAATESSRIRIQIATILGQKNCRPR